MENTGVGERLKCEGLGPSRRRTAICAAARAASIFRSLTGRAITVYAQQEVIKDLVAARLAAGGQIRVRGRGDKHRRYRRGPPQVRYRGHGPRARTRPATSSPVATASTAIARAADPSRRSHDLRARLSLRLARAFSRSPPPASRRADLRQSRPRLRAAQHALAANFAALSAMRAR